MFSSNNVILFLKNIMPMVLVMLVFYFLVIIPQQKKAKEVKQMLDLLKIGDEVVTSSGLIGNIVKLDNDKVVIELAPTVKIRLLKNAIIELNKN